jgi:hypothetical protein
MPPAAGQFGMTSPGGDPRSYRPTGCPSVEQFEQAFLVADGEAVPFLHIRPAVPHSPFG